MRANAGLDGSMVAVKRRIVTFRQDDRGDWIAELECGHAQHLRHDPPWTTRPWVTTAEGRAGFLGHALHCADCLNATSDSSANRQT